MTQAPAIEEFPEEECLRICSELNIWTSVDDCLVAARSLEQRTLPSDDLSEILVMPFLDDPDFEIALVRGFDWLIKSYRVPETKLRMAMLLDSEITSETRSVLTNLRFRPNVDVGPAGAIGLLFPPLADHRHERFFVIKDAPHVIELVQNPIRCLLDLMSRAWPTATQMKAIREEAVAKGEKPPTIFHQPYSDGPLFALIEALVFYRNGLALGPGALTDTLMDTQGINRGYRSFEVIARPPVNPTLFEIAQEMSADLFKSLE